MSLVAPIHTVLIELFVAFSVSSLAVIWGKAALKSVSQASNSAPTPSNSCSSVAPLLTLRPRRSSPHILDFRSSTLYAARSSTAPSICSFAPPFHTRAAYTKYMTPTNSADIPRHSFVALPPHRSVFSRITLNPLRIFAGPTLLLRAISTDSRRKSPSTSFPCLPDSASHASNLYVEIIPRQNSLYHFGPRADTCLLLSLCCYYALERRNFSLVDPAPLLVDAPYIILDQSAYGNVLATLLQIEGNVATKAVNLVQGENFAPSFLKLNPNGTVPTLEFVCLVKDAPRKVAAGTAIIVAIHDQQYDPNFAVFLARDDAELAAKSTGFPKTFIATRHPVLKKYAQSPEEAPYKAFYDEKIAFNTGILVLYKDTALPAEKAAFLAQSAAHFAALKRAAPGEDDFHVGGWITRIAALCGVTSAEDALAAFERAFGEPVPERVGTYCGAWTERESWRKWTASWRWMYAAPLH
ncbi:hypothetical protein DFH09DRAFT_1376330 [Mycena vulgaris]|nr:hypothetical protein DFH09DRAFT_1376330 [Mycena vulgaris]